MIACTSCGYTVDPKCVVCSGTGVLKEVHDVFEPWSSTVSSEETAEFMDKVLQIAAQPFPDKAIDLIGCAIVALKANVPLYRSPQVLLGLRKKEEGHGLWVLPGGKQDQNESPEECVRRETREEVGVSNLIGLKAVSFSYSSEDPTRKYLMLYYTAYVAGEAPKITAPHEFSDLSWFDVDMLPVRMWQSDRDAIAQTLLMRPK